MSSDTAGQDEFEYIVVGSGAVGPVLPMSGGFGAVAPA